jgi:hypothetical protein
MRKKSSTRARARKDTNLTPDTVYTRSLHMFRAGFKVTPAQSKHLFSFLNIPDLRSVDEVHMHFFIQKPEKKGGSKR